MAVKLRLRRMGRKKRPFYRIVAADSRSPRDGRFIEAIGTYDSLSEPYKVDFKEDRVFYWLENGAQPTKTVKSLLRGQGLWLKWDLKRRGADEAKITEELSKWQLLQEEKTKRLAAKQEKVKKAPAKDEEKDEEPAAEAKAKVEEKPEEEVKAATEEVKEVKEESPETKEEDKASEEESKTSEEAAKESEDKEAKSEDAQEEQPKAQG